MQISKEVFVRVDAQETFMAEEVASELGSTVFEALASEQAITYSELPPTTHTTYLGDQTVPDMD